MSEIDPERFGKMCGYVEATHEMVCDIKEANKAQDDEIKDHNKRIIDLENRNDNIKSNWKKVGFLSTSAAGVWAFFKMLGSALS